MSRTRTIRMLGVGLAVMLAVACGNSAVLPEAPPTLAGQPAGSVVVPAGTDAAAAVQRLQDAITAGGGTVAAVVDHAADAKAAGVEIPTDTVVIGGPAAAQLPLLRIDQRAAAHLPERYLVRQGGDGAVTITYNGAAFVAAVSGVVVDDARTPLMDSSSAVAVQAGPVAAAPIAAPLVGVGPADNFLAFFGSADVPVTVDRLRRNADRAPSRTVAVVDLAAGSADPGPAIRPTTLVLVSTPAVEAPLIAMAPSFGLELPMRYVVWLDDQNRTQIGYPDVGRLAARHGIPDGDPNVARMAVAADRLARLAAGTVQ